MMKRRLPEPSTLPLWPLVERYAEHMRTRRLKEISIHRNTTALLRLCAFMAQLGKAQAAEITQADLEAYQSHLLGLRIKTQQSYLTSARLFFRWLEISGLLFENPAAKLVIPRPREKRVKAPTESQVARLLEMPDVLKLTGIRDRAWLELAYSTGARRIEMFRLRVGDLDLQGRSVRLLGKGDKERLVPIGKQAANWLERYLTEARPKFLARRRPGLMPASTPPLEALWLSSRSGGTLCYAAIQQQLRGYARKAELPTSLLSAHNLRRACATHLLAHGASPFALQELLGHERIATLSHYVDQKAEDVKNTHRNSPPGR